MTAERLIEKARNKYPLSISFNGKLSLEQIKLIEKHCIIRCPSVYMDGTAVYSIRYRSDKE